jgi:hypothetical protein
VARADVAAEAEEDQWQAERLVESRYRMEFRIVRSKL